MSDNYSLSREDALGGSSTFLRRAHIVLFAIETRANQLAAQSLVPRCPIVAPSSLSSIEREQAFMGAIAQAREATSSVNIQDLERHARRWSLLVSSRAAEQASLAAGQEHSDADHYSGTALQPCPWTVYSDAIANGKLCRNPLHQPRSFATTTPTRKRIAALR
ncbi:MAG: hypothetical protein H7175_20270 [Burkholderiales bacterium]|nr:hypothetical protein [Anaerolineae bacterium]